MPSTLPPGPREPSLIQTLGWWNRPMAYLERNRARYGKRFTIRLLGTPPFVMLSDPAEIKELFTAPPDVLHPGEGARILEPVVGSNSVILLDEKAHLSQRKLMLPAFHGEKMEKLTDLVAEVAEREVESWPRDTPITLHPRLQALTLEIILRAVFGLDPGERLEAIRTRLTEILEIGSRPVGLIPQLQRAPFGEIGPWGRFERLSRETDALIYELIDERRAREEERDDILSMLLEARHEDGSPMSDIEIRDELMTLLVAGHETTASALAWAFERIARTPHVAERLREEIAAGEDALRHRDDPGDAAPPAGPPQRRPAPREEAGHGRRLGLPAGCRARGQRIPRAPRPRDLRQPVRVPSRAVPRRVAGHLHVDPVRRRPAAVPGRELRPARDEARAARGARAEHGAPERAGDGDRAAAGHHGEPAPRSDDRPRGRRPFWRENPGVATLAA